MRGLPWSPATNVGTRPQCRKWLSQVQACTSRKNTLACHQDTQRVYRNMDQELSRPEVVDPDPWTIVSVVINGVAMFAQLATLKIAAKAGPAKQPRHQLYELKNCVEEGIKFTERLVKLLGSMKTSEGGNANDGLFEFGEVTAYLDREEFSRYINIISQLHLTSSEINSHVVMLVLQHPNTAIEIGSAISNENKNISKTINDFYRARPSIDEVLSECLRMMRSFERILSVIEGNSN